MQQLQAETAILLHTGFTRIAGHPARPREKRRSSPMSANANDLRCLRSLAVRLRQLASGMLSTGDRALYLLTAEALEKHTSWLAGQEQNDPVRDAVRHQPVNLIV
jgi:hypothetical protein